MTKQIKPNVSNTIVDESGNIYHSIREASRVCNIPRKKISYCLKKNGVCTSGNTTLKLYYPNNDIQYSYYNEDNNETFEYNPEKEVVLDKEEYEEFKTVKEAKSLPFEKFDISLHSHRNGLRYAVALFSDAHIEETVTKESVLGKNEYNIDIACKRINNYFNNLAVCLNKDHVENLIFASLGDTITGFIHDELSQENGLTPSEAVIKAQSLLYSGLEFLCKNTNLKSIKFIGIVGNHSRTTKRIQHSNGYKMSYEWIMYQNLKNICEITKLPIDFCIPESEMAIVDTSDDKRFIFIHGFQIKSSGSGTVCGIYPALNRLSMKWQKTFHQDKIYLGHFHTCVSIPNATVNGSIIGFNSFALSNGFTYEEPAQMYEVYDDKVGLILTRKIYCD